MIPSIHKLEEGRHVSVLPAGRHDQFVQDGRTALPSVRVLFMSQDWKGACAQILISYTVKSRSSRVKLLSSSKKSAFKSFSDMH